MGKDIYAFWVTANGIVAEGNSESCTGLNCSAYVNKNHELYPLTDLEHYYPPVRNCEEQYKGKCLTCSTGYLGDTCNECDDGYAKSNYACNKIENEGCLSYNKEACSDCDDGYANNNGRCEKINNELKDLEVQNAKFNCKVEYKDNKEFTKNGLDDVEFLICTNIGDEEKPLIKIASGGEMSRIMLAIKSVLANVDKVPVLIFDEIDTGISGKAAKSVASKMKKIAKNHQILCITHLANIAAQGDYNYYISKSVVDGKTKTNIKNLNEEETLKEIARIATGDINDISIEHAKQLRVAI